MNLQPSQNDPMFAGKLPSLTVHKFTHGPMGWQQWFKMSRCVLSSAWLHSNNFKKWQSPRIHNGKLAGIQNSRCVHTMNRHRLEHQSSQLRMRDSNKKLENDIAKNKIHYPFSKAYPYLSWTPVFGCANRELQRVAETQTSLTLQGLMEFHLGSQNSCGQFLSISSIQTAMPSSLPLKNRSQLIRHEWFPWYTRANQTRSWFWINQVRSGLQGFDGRFCLELHGGFTRTGWQSIFGKKPRVAKAHMVDSCYFIPLKSKIGHLEIPELTVCISTTWTVSGDNVANTIHGKLFPAWPKIGYAGLLLVWKYPCWAKLFGSWPPTTNSWVGQWVYPHAVCIYMHSK